MRYIFVDAIGGWAQESVLVPACIQNMIQNNLKQCPFDKILFEKRVVLATLIFFKQSKV